MSGTGAVAEATRRLELKAEGSHVDAPERQAQQTDSTEDGANGASQTADQKLDMIRTMMKRVACKKTSCRWRLLYY